MARKFVTGTTATSAIGADGDGPLDAVAAGDGLGSTGRVRRCGSTSMAARREPEGGARRGGRRGRARRAARAARPRAGRRRRSPRRPAGSIETPRDCGRRTAAEDFRRRPRRAVDAAVRRAHAVVPWSRIDQRVLAERAGVETAYVDRLVELGILGDRRRRIRSRGRDRPRAADPGHRRARGGRHPAAGPRRGASSRTAVARLRGPAELRPVRRRCARDVPPAGRPDGDPGRASARRPRGDRVGPA